MAKKVAQPDYFDIPTTLSDKPFYGFTLDKYQESFRDAIWNPDKLIVFCNAVSGTGKTTIATATANLLCKYGFYDGIVYIVSNYGEAKQGYLPGDITQKSEVYFEPFYQALHTIGVNTNTVFADNINNLKNGTAYIECLTHTFLRGTNFDKKVIILDEAQNFTVADLKKTFTRCKDTCKVIVIGHNLQCDLTESKSSGFLRYMDWFKNDQRCAVCELKENYRGWISSHADRL